MKFQSLEHGVQHTFVLIFDKGDEFVRAMTAFAAENHLAGRYFTTIGAFRDVTLGVFDRGKKVYEKILLYDQVKVLSLVGDIALKEGAPEIHAHVVIQESDGSAHGGHLLQAHVWPTLEVVLTGSPKHLRRQLDAEKGLSVDRSGMNQDGCRIE